MSGFTTLVNPKLLNYIDLVSYRAKIKLFAPVSLQGSLSFMEDSGLSQPLTPSKPLAPAVEVTSVSFVPFNTELVFSIQDAWVNQAVLMICCQ